jgi:hypothetical protein
MHSTKTQLHGKIFGKSACVLCMEVSSSQPPQGLVKIIRKGAGDRERERGEEQGTESARVREQERERAREMIDSARAGAIWRVRRKRNRRIRRKRNRRIRAHGLAEGENCKEDGFRVQGLVGLGRTRPYHCGW